MPGREFQPLLSWKIWRLFGMRTLSSNQINVTEYGGVRTCTVFRAANSTLRIMAALEDVAVFGRRINIGVNGMALTRPLLILIYSGFRDQSFLQSSAPWERSRMSPGNIIGGERSVRGAANDMDAVFGLFSWCFLPLVIRMPFDVMHLDYRRQDLGSIVGGSGNGVFRFPSL